MGRRVTLLLRETLTVSRRGLRALVRRALTGRPDTYDAVFQAVVLVEVPDGMRRGRAFLISDKRLRPVIVLEQGIEAINVEIKELALQ